MGDAVFFVEACEDGAFDWEVGVDDVVAHEHEALVDRCVADLGALDGVVRAVREDRELILVAAPTLDAARLRAWLADWWAAHAFRG